MYYIYDPGDGEVEKFSSKKEWIKAIKEYDFSGKFCHDGWSENVWWVVAGKVKELWSEDKFEADEKYLDEQDYYSKHATHVVDEIVLKERPPENNIDQDGYTQEENGEVFYWGEYSKICDYHFIKKEPPQ